MGGRGVTPSILALGTKCRCGEFSRGGCRTRSEVRDNGGDGSTAPLYNFLYNFHFAPMTAEKLDLVYYTVLGYGRKDHKKIIGPGQQPSFAATCWSERPVKKKTGNCGHLYELYGALAPALHHSPPSPNMLSHLS